jgi:hypothetical protein
MTVFSLALNRDGRAQPDYRIVRGRLVLVRESDAVRDRLFVALSTQLTEWFLDVNDGVPYYQVDGAPSILGGKMTEAEVSALIRRRILLDPETDSIESMSVRQDALRRVSVAATVKLRLASGASETILVEV